MISFESYDTTQMQLIHPIQNGKLLFPRCILPDHPTFVPIRDTFVELMNMCRDDALTYQLYTKSSLLRILALLSASRLFVPAEKNYDKRVDELKKIITYIMENYREKIYIRDLAALVNMNEQYFCRFFKKSLGRSPMEYLNEYRIKQAMRLLEETDLPVTEVCLECGYNNLGNFLRAFKKYTQTTPLKYRNRFHKEEKMY